jgi:hypothetical protein
MKRAISLFVSADVAGWAIMHTALQEIVTQAEDRPFEFSGHDAAEIASAALEGAEHFNAPDGDQNDGA